MSWGKKQIDRVVIQSAACDYVAFEKIGLESIEDARVLDVGCFDGYNTVLKFAPYDNIAQVIGIDPEGARLEEARKKTSDSRFSWVETTAENYDNKESSFDVVYFSHVFQHVKDKKLVACRAFNLLKPGGHIVIKTLDDSCKLSYPDPKNIMRRLFALYEKEVLPRTLHTRYTDRNNGHKCPALLKQAGFEDIQVKIITTDTLNKTLEERMQLFERFTYFRKNIPEGMSEKDAEELRELMAEWKELFTREDYYHASNTFVVTAQKPATSKTSYLIENKTGEHTSENGEAHPDAANEIYIEPMTEDSLGKVMTIEVNAFPDPWAPIAYAMELRHNPAAHYVVATDNKHSVYGYVGWWETNQGVATIMHIAVDAKQRKGGIGSKLLSYACSRAAKAGCVVMTLQVRANNSTARSFYKHCGFQETGLSEGYYTGPDDDAIAMQKTLG